MKYDQRFGSGLVWLTNPAILHFGTVGPSPAAANFHLFLWGSPAGVVGFGNGYGFGVIRGTSPEADGAWHHVVGVYEGPDTDLARIYVDGELQSSGTLTNRPQHGLGYALAHRSVSGQRRLRLQRSNNDSGRQVSNLREEPDPYKIQV